MSGSGSATNLANYQLFQGVTDISASIASASYGYSAATGRYQATLNLAVPLRTGSFQLKLLPTMLDSLGAALDGDANGNAGAEFARSFTVATMYGAGSRTLVNTVTQNHQSLPKIAADDDGNYVVVWESYSEDGSGYGIYARRFNAAGVPQGAGFRVNTVTTGQQLRPSVAMDADGDFVMAWQSGDGNGYGIYAQRFNAAGSAQGGEIQVNAETAGQQEFPTVAMDDEGDFMVAWESFDGNGYGIFAPLQCGRCAIQWGVPRQHRHQRPSGDTDDCRRRERQLRHRLVDAGR